MEAFTSILSSKGFTTTNTTPHIPYEGQMNQPNGAEMKVELYNWHVVSTENGEKKVTKVEGIVNLRCAITPAKGQLVFFERRVNIEDFGNIIESLKSLSLAMN